MGPEKVCNIICRPLNVSARAQARHAVAPMFGARAERGCPYGDVFGARAERDCPYGDVFRARAERDCPYGDVLFFADFVTCANFSNLCGKFLKTHNRYGHHVSAKSCAGSWATFSSKKISKKIRLHGFFLKELLKKRYF